MLSCKEVTRRIATDEHAEGGWRARMAVSMHLLFCRFCRMYARQIRLLGQVARGAWAAEADDPAVVERLRKRIFSPPPTEPEGRGGLPRE